MALENVLVDGTSFLDREQIVPSITSSASRADELEFDYIGIDLSSPEKITYQYMLEGEDSNWHDAGSRRQAFYTHLSPGRYHFRVRCTNGKNRGPSSTDPCR